MDIENYLDKVLNRLNHEFEIQKKIELKKQNSSDFTNLNKFKFSYQSPKKQTGLKKINSRLFTSVASKEILNENIDNIENYKFIDEKVENLTFESSLKFKTKSSIIDQQINKKYVNDKYEYDDNFTKVHLIFQGSSEIGINKYDLDDDTDDYLSNLINENHNSLLKTTLPSLMR